MSAKSAERIEGAASTVPNGVCIRILYDSGHPGAKRLPQVHPARGADEGLGGTPEADGPTRRRTRVSLVDEAVYSRIMEVTERRTCQHMHDRDTDDPKGEHLLEHLLERANAAIREYDLEAALGELERALYGSTSRTATSSPR